MISKRNINVLAQKGKKKWVCSMLPYMGPIALLVTMSVFITMARIEKGKVARIDKTRDRKNR
jgi:hypothetical protein